MLNGSCLCGAIAYEADAPLERIVHCHCRTCRKTHGAAFSSVTAVPRAAFRWLRGQELLRANESSPGKFRRFCGTCGSHLMAERVDQPVVLLRLGCLDTPRDRQTADPYLAVRRGTLVRPQGTVAGDDAGTDMSPPDGVSPAFLPFHEDELAAQRLAGQIAGRAPIRPFMPEQHRAFFALLPTLFAATLDADGWPMASVLTGAKGFIQSPDATTLRIAALPAEDDPAASGFREGAGIGLIGLEFTTRRRNRANGRVIAVDEDGLAVRVAQSFGNCAQYIQTRDAQTRARQLQTVAPAPLETLAGLDEAARALIATSDTFFVASRSRAAIGAEGGLDMSHRGGRPGFVGVQADTLAIPDFRGNRFFNTLGNLLGDARAGLIFPDFETGDILQLQGRAEIDWRATGGPAGAERLWRLRVERAWRRRGALLFTWTFGAFAPTTLATGVW